MGDQSVEAGSDSTVEQGGTDRRTRQYVRGGHCLLHGGGALQRFRGGHRMVRERGGIPAKRYTREYYYVCDLARGGRRGKLRQTALSFPKITVNKRSDSADSSVNFLTSTVGQSNNGSSTDHGECGDEKKLGDEKRNSI